MTNASHNSPVSPAWPGGKIFLIGFMGSGKTYWGKIWAQQSGLAFYDLDEEIEKDQGQNISLIFERNGEDHFRKIESVALRAVEETENCIIACGGGTPCFYDNMQWMNAHGTTVYLQATPAYILSRVKTEKDKRPLIHTLNEGELLFFIEQKLKAREPFYNQAKIILPVTELKDNSLQTLNPKP